MDRRRFLAAVICGAGAGVALAPVAAQALSLAAGETGKLGDRLADDVQRAQVRVVHGRPRHRRWVCWWHRGHRVCGWRWM
jgi:hypothetical protein